MNKEKFYSILLVISLVLALCSCGKELETGDKQNSDEEKIRISYSLWGDEERQEYTKKSIEKFEELHPNIKVDVTFTDWGCYLNQQDIAMASGTEADLMQIDYRWIQRYSSDGEGFYDLQELSDFIDLSQYDYDDYKYGYSNDVLNALPVAMETSAAIYNESIYKKYCLNIPSTWDDLFTAAERMRGDNIYPICMTDKELCSWLFSYYLQCSERYFTIQNGKIILSKIAMKDLANLYTRLVDEKVICPPGEYTEDMLVTGQAAGIICKTSEVDSVYDSIIQLGDEAALGTCIQKSNKKMLGHFAKPGIMLAISKNTEHPTEAACLLEYLCSSKENALLQRTEKGLPANRSAEMYLMEAGEYNNLSYSSKIMMDYENENLKLLPEVFEQNYIIKAVFRNLEKYRKGEIELYEATENISDLVRSY